MEQYLSDLKAKYANLLNQETLDRDRETEMAQLLKIKETKQKIAEINVYLKNLEIATTKAEIKSASTKTKLEELKDKLEKLKDKLEKLESALTKAKKQKDDLNTRYSMFFGDTVATATEEQITNELFRSSLPCMNCVGGNIRPRKLFSIPPPKRKTVECINCTNPKTKCNHCKKTRRCRKEKDKENVRVKTLCEECYYKFG